MTERIKKIDESDFFTCVDEIINEDNRLKFEAYGDSPPRPTDEEMKETGKLIRAIKEKKKQNEHH